MQNGVLMVLVAYVLAGSSCRNAHDSRPPAGPEQHFSLLLEHSKSGWAAHCETGCSWKNVTMQCTKCKVRIDADGIYDANVARKSRGFSFVLDDTNGLSAHALQGVRWTNLSWNCASDICRSRLNEEGVYVPA